MGSDSIKFNEVFISKHRFQCDYMCLLPNSGMSSLVWRTYAHNFETYVSVSSDKCTINHVTSLEFQLLFYNFHILSAYRYIWHLINFKRYTVQCGSISTVDSYKFFPAINLTKVKESEQRNWLFKTCLYYWRNLNTKHVLESLKKLDISRRCQCRKSKWNNVHGNPMQYNFGYLWIFPMYLGIVG